MAPKSNDWCVQDQLDMTVTIWRWSHHGECDHHDLARETLVGLSFVVPRILRPVIRAHMERVEIYERILSPGMSLTLIIADDKPGVLQLAQNHFCPDWYIICSDPNSRNPFGLTVTRTIFPSLNPSINCTLHNPGSVLPFFSLVAPVGQVVLVSF
jgi:hypothetical protein